MNDDLISRQELLKSIERISVKGDVLDDDWIYRFIQEFPSAQPVDKDINDPNNDIISRKAAIDAIRASASKYTGFMEMEMYTDDDAVEAIKGLSPVQTERKKGKWILTKNDIWCCSECMAMAPYYYMSEQQRTSKYCYACGAKMENIDSK